MLSSLMVALWARCFLICSLLAIVVFFRKELRALTIVNLRNEKLNACGTILACAQFLFFPVAEALNHLQ